MQYSLDHIHLRCSDVATSVDYFKNMFQAKEIARTGTREMPITILEMAGERFSFSPKREEVNIQRQARRTRLGHLSDRIEGGQPGCILERN